MPRDVLRLEAGSNVLVHVGCKQKYRLGFTSPSETEILPSLRDMPPAGDVNLNYREIGGGELAMELSQNLSTDSSPKQTQLLCSPRL